MTTPAGREQFLASVRPESAQQHHQTLRQLFTAEMAYRQRDQDGAYFENLYWCAYLLFTIGDPGDTESMWQAKHINMDTGCGFDAENMVGAGMDATVAYLNNRGLHDASRYLLSCPELQDRSHIASWALDRRRYFYGT